MNTSNGFLKNEYHLKEPQNRAVPSANNVVNMPQNICRQVVGLIAPRCFKISQASFLMP